MTNEFYKEIRKRNKENFIAIRTKQLKEEHKNQNGVFIPEFLDALNEFEQFQAADAFDSYGYLKPMEAGA